jgi:hypothetical protein
MTTSDFQILQFDTVCLYSKLFKQYYWQEPYIRMKRIENFMKYQN